MRGAGKSRRARSPAAVMLQEVRRERRQQHRRWTATADHTNEFMRVRSFRSNRWPLGGAATHCNKPYIRRASAFGVSSSAPFILGCHHAAPGATRTRRGGDPRPPRAIFLISGGPAATAEIKPAFAACPRGLRLAAHFLEIFLSAGCPPPGSCGLRSGPARRTRAGLRGCYFEGSGLLWVDGWLSVCEHLRQHLQPLHHQR